ncbi:hypothetical protein ABBQ38_007294 [Trebouxia sp. C0009 RCD-2024]
MAAINDISDTDATLNSESVPTSAIDQSAKYKHNPQTPAVAAPSSVSRPDKADNRRGGVSRVPKGGAGAHNWGGIGEATEYQLSTGTDADNKVPAEAVLEPESDAEERRARNEAADPNTQAKTLDEYEMEGHKV